MREKREEREIEREREREREREKERESFHLSFLCRLDTVLRGQEPLLPTPA